MSLVALDDVAAPAKINLFLHVVGRRADGYHLLQSALVLIDWCDTLHFERRSDSRLIRHDLTTPLPADDLCLRAARALQSAAQTPLGADISVEKCIPTGAGLGGGSSDAASTLLALNRLWDLRWPRSRLMALGLQLGADVPFFVGGANALVGGIGEQITPIVLPLQRLAVLKPHASLQTRAVFDSPLLAQRAASESIETDIVAGFPGVASSGFGRNDLQAAAAAQCGEVGEALALLQRHFGNSRMTGSGSAVFASLTGDAATFAASTLPRQWQFRVCRTLPRHPLSEWAAGGARHPARQDG